MSAREIAARQHIEAQYAAAVRDFETAVRYFQKEKFDKAREIFQKLADGPVREVAPRARIHLQLCDQKLRAVTSSTAPKSAEDFYNLGVIALNARNFDQAIENLNKAEKLEPNQEHIRYALAAAHALQGNVDAAIEQLSAAISLRPENRFRARRDEDFQAIAADPRFRQLVSS